MAITTAERKAIIEVTVAMFGAAPGGYMADLVQMFENAGKNLSQFAKDLAHTPAFQDAARYPNYLTTDEIATKMTQAYGLDPNDNGAGAAAKAYFLGQLNAATGHIYNTIGDLFVQANNYLDTVAANDPNNQYHAAAQALANKEAVAEYYTITMAATSKDLGTLSAVLSNVDANTDVTNPATVINSTPAAATGQTFTLTTGVVDSITGTSGNDTIIADNTGANPQLSIADQIDGGAGTDTLKIYDNSAVPSITLTSAVQGIENVYVNDSNTEMTNNGSVDVSALTGVQNLTLDLFNLAANKLTVKAGDGVKYAFQNIASGNAASTIDLGNKTATSMDVEVNKVGDSTNDVTIENVTGAKVDTLNVTASGKSYIEVADTAGTLKTVNISGSADLTVTDVADATTIAITNTGKTALSTGVAKVSVTGGDAAETITFTYADTAGNADNGEFTVNGGKGDDTIVIKNYTDRGDLKDDKVTISGGDGNDTLSMTSELAADLSGLTASAYAKKGIANDFETLKLSNNATANGTVDLSILGSNITKVDYNQGIDYTQTLNGLASDGTVELSGAKGTNSPSLIVNVKDAAVAGHNSDVLNIVLNGLTGGSTSGTVNTVDYGSITAASVETVNIESTVDPTNTAALVSGNKNIAALTINNVQNVVIKGDAYLDISGTPLAGNSLAKIDASGNSAGVKMSTAGATQGIELIGTDAADDITGGNGADVITAGKGGDKVKGGQGDDTINLGAADGKTDTVVFRAAGTNGKDTINDFEAGNNGDVLKVTVLGTLVGSAGTYTTASSTSKGDTAAYKVIAITDNAASDWSDVLTKMNAALTIAGDTNAGNAETAVLIDNGTDTRVYLFSDDSTNNTTVESSEITLVGTISGLGDVSDLVSGNFA